jgi:hypothetical protein
MDREEREVILVLTCIISTFITIFIAPPLIAMTKGIKVAFSVTYSYLLLVYFMTRGMGKLFLGEEDGKYYVYLASLCTFGIFLLAWFF